MKWREFGVILGAIGVTGMDIQQEAFAPAAHAACLDDVGAVSAIDFGLPCAERARADEFDELLRVHEYERRRMGQDFTIQPVSSLCACN